MVISLTIFLILFDIVLLIAVIKLNKKFNSFIEKVLNTISTEQYVNFTDYNDYADEELQPFAKE